jgi:hypothetical protein
MKGGGLSKSEVEAQNSMIKLNYIFTNQQSHPQTVSYLSSEKKRKVLKELA